MAKKLYIIDGNSFCYRAFYAIRQLSTSSGRPTNAIYGVITMINKIIAEKKPDMMAVCFDLKGPTFRHKKFEDYKAHRKPMPDDLVSQMPVIKDVIKAYRIPIFELQGYEADDIIATITKKSEKKGIEVYIVTGDKDALQLVNEMVKVYNPHKNDAMYDSLVVKAEYGVSPQQITDLLAVMGDSSDNIPGIKGIGEKGARELIAQFGSLEEMLNNIENVKSPAKRKLIEASKDTAIMSKELATMDENVPIDIDHEALLLQKADDEALAKLFRELEFKTLLKKFVTSEGFDGVYELIDSKEKFDKLLTNLKAQKEFALDFETTHEDPMLAEPIGISFSYEKKKACYVPFNLKKELGKDVVLKALKQVLEDKNIKKIGQNIKYEFIILANQDIKLEGISFDTMVASYILNPSKLNHNLNDLSIEHLDHAMTPIESLIGKGKDAITMDKVDIDKVMNYSSEDSDVTFRLKEIFEKEMRAKETISLFDHVEMPLVRVLALMEIQGVSIDTEYLKGLSEEMEKKLDASRKKIFEISGEEFNVNSPKQMQHILFEKLKMPVVKRTKTGPSTDEEVLTKLSETFELPKELLKYREISKLKSTYVDALPGLVNPKTSRIHTSFNQTVTQTGRLSSSGPNLQNIPIKTDEGRKVRKAFVTSSDKYVLLSADYSQIELRVLAHMSKDENLVKAFKDDKDIHRFTASLIYGVDEKDVTDQMRSNAKTVNFGIVYGMGHYKLSKDLGIRIDEAKAFIENYFARYSGVKKYLDMTIAEAREKKFVTTILNRRRYIPEILSDNMTVRGFAERTATNTPLQGSAADLIKVAMINIQKKLEGSESKMLLQVHDELVFEVKKDGLQKTVAMIKHEMEHAIELDVPVKVNIETGKNWLDQEEYLI